MKTKIHIVECEDTLKIIKDYQIKDGCINIRHYDDYDGEEGYYSEKVPVTILNTFSVITKGEFIRDENDKSKLNACNMDGGFGRINRLGYSYSVVVIYNAGSTSNLWKSDLIYSDAGIKSTRFDMYSYHVNEPEKSYTEDRLDYEVFESLNLTKILSKYLTKSHIRDSIIDDILD